MRSKSPARLLDREAELEAIAAAVEQALAGSGATLVVEGVAGIGKTCLLTCARERAAAAGMTVLEARAAEFEGAYAWGVVRQLFERLVVGEPRLLSGAAELAGPALGLGAAGEDPFAVMHGLYWLAANLAQEAPLLVAVDDLHWADGPSLRAIAHLVRRLEGLPILVAVALRSARPGDDAVLAGLATEPGAMVLRPGALGVEACAELVRAELGDGATAAFHAACHEFTRGNPFLLRALLAALAADGVSGGDEDVERVRRMTPAAVSRGVLLQLGRSSAAARAVARAVAIFGTAATAPRVYRLAELEPEAGAQAVEALMAEGLLEGHPALRFVHPLVRSAVHEDIAPPVRERWHERAARLLAEERAPLDELAVHLLASGRRGDPWLVEQLRRAATDAGRRGAPDLAAVYLERALAEPPAAGAQADVLVELGTLEIALAPARAVEHLTAALAADPRRRAVAPALAHALAVSGRFAEAVDLLEQHLDESPELQAALLSTARWDPATRDRTAPLLADLRRRAEGGEDLDTRLRANLGVELAAGGSEREVAVDHARAALRDAPRLIALGTPVLPDTMCVLLFADLAEEADAAAREWVHTAQRRGWRVAAAAASVVVTLIRLRGGAVSDAVAWGRQALAGGEAWLAPAATAFLVSALIERGELEAARAALAEHGLDSELAPTWPFQVARHARGCLHAAAGDHQAAIADLTAAGERAEHWGIRNPAMMDWRSAAGLSLLALGRTEEARRLCAEELELARRWGAARALGVALRAAGLAAGDVELLAEAVRVLQSAPAPLELARAHVELGAAQRRAGSRVQAREHLRIGLDLAHRQGGLAVAERAREELVVAGGRPRRDALRGRDALTPSELRVVEMAAEGLTNRQIAQALFVTQRTVEVHLTSSYGKLGISSRRGLADALAAG